MKQHNFCGSKPYGLLHQIKLLILLNDSLIWK
uniref:Uncharacterized protein n=1 Tax=Arundo donax TaxID=35708 RepID=A0A0A9BRZ9_ARUDO